MRKVFLLLLGVSFLAVVTTSCDTDDDGKYSVGDFIVSLGVVQKESPDASSYVIKMDNGDSFVPVATSVPFANIYNNQRVWMNFNPLDDKTNSDGSLIYYGKLNDLRNILYKDISVASQVDADSMGYDPIDVKDIWMSQDSILNVEISFYTAGSTHYINLVNDETGDGVAQPYMLDLKHNARGDEQAYRTSGIVSFKLGTLKAAGNNSINFIVRYTNYDGQTIQEPVMTYHYGT
ncbi:hypothetical protein PbJCM13498_25430 [Prolixibacter bellariivorans]|uniref:NigD-like C-terminal domain-containing protein n=1 Tax=Prolixibacter bellariivorans TaxID=314319 RepID=A0A5M4B0K0_9BACT|nr:NigD-like C-terminal domain-containing protein [Prolixibacter bellariivorans]GET33680.1 hypothetical protein PbJCM13498_25430 [Prolixibacter bellariivorans]